MKTAEQGGAAVAAVEVAEERQKMLMDEMTVLDFDMLCSTVAMQVEKGKWGILNNHYNNDEDDDDENEGVMDGYGGVLRMWEGEIVYDCLDDRRIALQSTCCPCYRFGMNTKRAGLGSCYLQGLIYLILAITALFNWVAFITTSSRCFLYLAIFFTLLVGMYLGYHRAQIRKRFHIKGDDSSFDDCVYHLVCPCCTLCQESRTLEMNNVQDGIWHGRGDTICIGSLPEDRRPFMDLNKSPELITMQKTSNEGGI